MLEQMAWIFCAVSHSGLFAAKSSFHHERCSWRKIMLGGRLLVNLKVVERNCQIHVEAEAPWLNWFVEQSFKSLVLLRTPGNGGGTTWLSCSVAIVPPSLSPMTW
ncbi:MAG: hypothetical protein PHV34_11920 [Verrucomicrobiae bacterium]|nr:hypothetical protein [Verrucomicrobiae bacterium]